MLNNNAFDAESANDSLLSVKEQSAGGKDRIHISTKSRPVAKKVIMNFLLEAALVLTRSIMMKSHSMNEHAMITPYELDIPRKNSDRWYLTGALYLSL